MLDTLQQGQGSSSILSQTLNVQEQQVRVHLPGVQRHCSVGVCSCLHATASIWPGSWGKARANSFCPAWGKLSTGLTYTQTTATARSESDRITGHCLCLRIWLIASPASSRLEKIPLDVEDWWAPGGCCTAYLQLVARLRGHVGKVVVQLCETAVLLLVMTRAASAAQQVCYPGIRLHRMAC